MFYAVTITVVIGSDIAGDLNNAALSPYIASVFLLFAAVSAPIYARLYDVYGSAKSILSAGGILCLGIVGCALAPNMTFFLSGRAISGIGSGGISIISSILLSGKIYVLYKKNSC